MNRNLLLMHSYQEPNSPRESHPSARRREPQTGAGQANGPALLRFGWTIFDNGLLCQSEVGSPAELDIGSRRGEGEGFYINWLSLDLSREGSIEGNGYWWLEFVRRRDPK